MAACLSLGRRGDFLWLVCKDAGCPDSSGEAASQSGKGGEGTSVPASLRNRRGPERQAPDVRRRALWASRSQG